MTLTIKELTDAVGEGITPRMVRHYHQVGLLPQPARSPGNYRLYSAQDVQRLRRIMALKRQGFQLSHIHKLLGSPEFESDTLMAQLQQQYRAVMQQMTQLRQTAAALEGLLGRDRNCQVIQAEALAQLKQLQAETHANFDGLDKWSSLDAEVHTHPEVFQESLQRLLPDLGIRSTAPLEMRSEIEVNLLSQLVLACGDVSLVAFTRLSRGSQNAIAAARTALQAGCPIVVDTTMIATALDHTRLAHLGCTVETLITDPHVHQVTEVEQEFWGNPALQHRLRHLPDPCILVIGYAPSILLAACAAIEQGLIHPALIIGMPIGFSHAPAAKRRLMQSAIPYITIEGTLGGGLLAATSLNALVESLLEKPDCHCYLNGL